MNANLQRASMLLEQSRYQLAEEELRKVLAAEPNSPEAHSLLAVCLAEQKQFVEATEEAQQGIAHAPDDAWAHYVLARVFFARNRLPEAESSINEAIQLNPYGERCFGLLAAIQHNCGRWKDALASAEQGLAINAEDVQCNNLRAMALVKLGRKQEAAKTIDAALANEPDNALTHANRGWTLLEQRDTQKALEHFREALRLDPELVWARAGIVEALKARNPLYSLFLRYFLWMAKLPVRVQFALIIGLVIGNNILRSIVNAVPALEPLAFPLTAAYFLFVILTWSAYPLFNLLLRLNTFGRHALSREQTIGANWIGVYVLGAFVGTTALFACSYPDAWSADILKTFAFRGIGLIALIIPMAATFYCSTAWARTIMGLTTAALTLLAYGAVGMTVVSLRIAINGDPNDPIAVSLVDLANNCFAYSLIGVFLSTWLGNFLQVPQEKH